jgi:AcrR family transcriptional regulator
VTDLADPVLRRPQRADARRNYDALIAAARDAFAELGTAAPLEDVARRAGVGIATLYRNFPTREDLVESVYVDEVEAVSRAAAEAEGIDPWADLVTWLRRFVGYIGTKKVLIEGINRDSARFKSCLTVLYDAGEPLLTAAQQSGAARPDATISDVLRLVSGVTAVGFTDDAQRDFVLGMAIDGIRVARSPG